MALKESILQYTWYYMAISVIYFSLYAKEPDANAHTHLAPDQEEDHLR
jgi:hypothetical protein